MTFEKLQEILERNKIPKNVELLSDSGWECSETEMNGIYYNKEKNHIIFTQEYQKDYEQYSKDKNYKELR